MASSLVSTQALVLLLASAAWLAPTAGALAEPTPPLAETLAVKAAQSALGACESQGLRVSVSIVDREGVQRILLVGDGAGPIGVATSRRKAYTAAALGISTGDMQRQPPPPGSANLQIDPEVLPLAGGLPIRRGDVVIAGIGVGGADRSDKDEACAQAGLDAIKDHLNRP